jgi:nucleotide-binding universal stress UspA family protein
MTTLTEAVETGDHPVRPARPHRVVLATDGGLAGTAAVRWLADRAGTLPIDVEVVEVLEPTHPVAEGTDPSAEARMTADHARDLLMQLAPHISVQSGVEEGEAIATLQRLTAGAELVVVGTNRAPRSGPQVGRSFATRLASACSSPVVVVPRGWEVNHGPVVVGIEGDGSDERALEFSAGEAERTGRQLVIVTAWRLIAATLLSGEEELEGSGKEEVAEARLHRAVKRVHERHPGVHVAPLLGHGDPVHLLVRAGQGSSLVVVGRHSLDKVHRVVPRSVSERILEHPTCPMVVVPAVE